MAAQERRLHVLQSHLAQVLDAEDCSVLPRPTSAQFNAAKLLDGKVAIITGSGQGLGAAAAMLFAEHGAKVVVSDLDGEKATKVAQKLQEKGCEALVTQGDVTADDYAQKVVDATIARFGRIDILVNNAGFTWDGMLHRMSQKQWDAMLAVHCTAPFKLIQAVAPYMREAAKREIEQTGSAQERCIINISSTSGTHGNTGQANYSTAKAGVVGLTKTVAKEWGPFNIRCNAIAYGMINTRLTQAKENKQTITVAGETVKLGIPQAMAPQSDLLASMIPLGRVGSPEEGAGVMLMLACPYSSFITGQCIEVTGGAFV